MDEADLRIEITNRAVPGAPCTAKITHLPTGLVAFGTSLSRITARAEALARLSESLGGLDTGHAAD